MFCVPRFLLASIALFLSSITPNAAATDCFRAAFDHATTGVSGHFDLTISADSVVYAWSFDVTDLSTSCAAEEGMDVHVHSDWAGFGAGVTSSVTACGGAGGHYDPTLACSTASSMATECALLNRTGTQGYTYACNPADFAAGQQYQCEVGDISGKLGTFAPDAGTNYRIYSGSYSDPFPPTAVNFGGAGGASGIATQWVSLVLHCPSTGARLLCAQFAATSCAGLGGDDSGDDLSFTSGELAGIILGSSFGMAALIVFVMVCLLGCKRKSAHDLGSGSEAKTMLGLQQRS